MSKHSEKFINTEIERAKGKQMGVGQQFEEIRDLLAYKLKREKARLKTYGTKADSFSLAHAIAQHVRSLRAAARWAEVHEFKRRIIKKYGKEPKKKSLKVVLQWLRERERDLAVMRDALRNDAELRDLRRPRKSSASLEMNHHRKSKSSKHKNR
jgi:hypothetical protein